jgi:periplasmic divalent cation tolerance protein
MTDRVIVFVSCESKQQAEQIAEALVRDKLAACVNLLPGARSCYVWEEKLTWSDEVLCMVKTTRGRFSQLEQRVRAMHSYTVPEIASVAIEDAESRYADWIDRSVGG